MAHQWYSIQTYGSERAVREAILNMIEEMGLQDFIKEVIVPTEDVIEVKDGKKKITERSLYSGYVFANIDLNTEVQHLITALPKVSGFIGEANTPTPLSEHDINVILDRVNNRAAPKPKVYFDNGETVRIIDGPFANFTATVDEYDLEHGTLKLNVSIFGRATPVDISYTQVEKII
ncbi:transcription termination/antitermination protein NusG [Sulfurimonas sp. CS5]|jgi:transcriptional antiterminator NusG|uniref:transcription termination/antitermination protein NusG n=1 Tax=Sulfurimonas sp. CS5 TaxID=3391145 RepID=UPI0039E884A5